MEFALQVYMKDLKKISPLTMEEEQELFKKLNGGDLEARDSIVTAYLPLVIKIAGRFVSYGTSLLDLISEGNIGLIRAMERFDYTLGQRFGKYASWWIKWTIQRALINNSKTVHIPIYMAERISKWKKISSRLSNTLCRVPDRNEIAQALNLNEKQARWVEMAVMHTYTLTKTRSKHDDSAELSEHIPDESVKMPDDELIELHDRKKLMKLLETIDRQEAKVLKMRYGFDNAEPMTLREISKKLNISREWVRKIEKKALSRLNQLMSCHEQFINEKSMLKSAC
ncbi:MAG: RNA polymerase subunit sigma [Candidatus Brocadia sp. WS118]|nr:MAG: RNA polymerase subunit sigma [Candidatus Brocadia sp. WS118]